MTIAESIENDLVWREDELASLKHQVNRQAPASLTHKSLLRALWTMLYAHYEGFCHKALQGYLAELQTTQIARSACNYRLQVFSLQNDIAAMKNNQSRDQCYDFFEFVLPRRLREAIRFEVDPKTGDFKLEGRSNLWPNLLRENCANLGLPTDFIANAAGRLELLVRRRNSIAHGGNDAIEDIKQYQLFEDAVFDVMVALGVSIIEAVDGKKYHAPAFDVGRLGRWLAAEKF